MPRPPVSLWILNQLAREQPALIDSYLEAARLLREAHQSGGDIRAATPPQRDAESRVLAAAVEFARTHDQSATETVQRGLREALNSAAADADVAAVVRDGRLIREPEAPSIDELLWSMPQERSTAKARGRPTAEAPTPRPEGRTPGASAAHRGGHRRGVSSERRRTRGLRGSGSGESGMETRREVRGAGTAERGCRRERPRAAPARARRVRGRRGRFVAVRDVGLGSRRQLRAALSEDSRRARSGADAPGARLRSSNRMTVRVWRVASVVLGRDRPAARSGRSRKGRSRPRRPLDAARHHDSFCESF